MLDVNLQLFAEGEGEEVQEQTQEVRTYTEDEVKDLLQKETDRRVSDAIKKREEKLREEMSVKIEQEKKEAERLAKLSSEEKEKELLEKTRLDVEKREKALKQKELLSDAKDMLYEAKIPVTFADMLVKSNAEETLESIKTFSEQWQKALEEHTNERLKGKSLNKSTADVGGKNPFSQANQDKGEQDRMLKQEPERAKALMVEAYGEDYNEAMSKGERLKAIKIKQEAYKQGIVI